MKSQNVFTRFRPVIGSGRRNTIPRMSRLHFSRILLALACLLPVLAAPAPAQAAPTGLVYVVQGLPGTTLDVAVDGRTVVRGAKAATVSGPFQVAAGNRRIIARSGGKVVLDRMIRVTAGGSLDAVLHLPAAPTGAPVVTTYSNKLAAVASGKAAVRVAHTAAVPPADIRVNGQVLFSNVANGESLDVVVPAATYRVEIVPTGTNGPRLLGPLPLTVKARSLTRVFAIGTPATKTMNVAVGVISLPATGTDKPSQVDTGTGGQAAQLPADPAWPTPAVAVLAALLAAAALMIWRKPVLFRRRAVRR